MKTPTRRWRCTSRRRDEVSAVTFRVAENKKPPESLRGFPFHSRPDRSSSLRFQTRKLRLLIGKDGRIVAGTSVVNGFPAVVLIIESFFFGRHEKVVSYENTDEGTSA